MTVPTVACTNCGKNFTTDDLRGTNCRYCGTLLAHHARAAQQVAVVNQMMADRNGNGIPDAYEGLVANAQANAMNQAFGMNPHPMHPMQPMQPTYPVAVQAQQATRALSKVVLVIVIVSIVGAVLLTILGVVLALVLRG